MTDTYEKVSVHEETAPVLIVGGSLVGLSASIFLSWHRVPSLLVERHSGISLHPRAFNFNVRTMELFRAAGIEGAIRRAEPPNAQNSIVLQAESLAGKELRRITQDSTGSDLSPVQGSLIGQDALEPILRKRAEELGGDLRFHTELVSFTQNADGVSAIIRDRATGVARTVRASYLIAADGNDSAIRQQLGIKVHGPGILGHQLTIHFSTDLREALRGRRIAICFVNNAIVRGGTLVLARGADQGFGLYAHYYPEKGERVEDFAGSRGIEMIHAAIGVSDLPIEILNVRPWKVAAWTAERFQQDKVFLVGDAGHVMPPAGAFGANTGIADAYNLAWKLALVLKKAADSTLLSTYTAERQPVARFTAEQAFSMFARFASPSDQKRSVPVVNYDAVASGYRYHPAPALSPSETHDISEDHKFYEDPHHPTGRPGTHAAHVLLARNGEQISTLDLFGRNIVLFAGPDGGPWCDTARYSSERLGLALDSYRIGSKGDFIDSEGRFLESYGVSASGAVIVRPDGFISWRAQAVNDCPEQTLEQALERLLGRVPT